MGELVSGTNIIHILENFKVNTDAQATNQGFYYQYLITLDDWLGYYLDKSNIAVYCETEDDIKAENSRESHIAFTQVKAYAKDFTLKSVEVRKSIINFFQLFVEYRNKGISSSFIFHTNTDFEGDFFNRSNGVVEITSIEKEKCINEIEKLLISEFEKKNKKKLEQLDRDIQTNNNEIKELSQQKAIESREEKIKTLEDNKNEINSELDELNQYIKNEAPTFIKNIEWKAEKRDKEDSISEFIQSIEGKIAKIIIPQEKQTIF